MQISIDRFSKNSYIRNITKQGDNKRMRNPFDTGEIPENYMGLLQNLDTLAAKVSKLEKQITKMPFVSQDPGLVKATRSNIIPFPGSNSLHNSGKESDYSLMQRSLASSPFLAFPGRPLPEGIHDFRPVLQRDGLILLAWDKHVSEIGERYTAYWVTSVGTPRFYASKSLFFEDFPSARPDHKSYAAEDGIEFYGQKAPAYMVHVAPELMMSNPMHVELRPAHINKLKFLGSKINFNYKYLLKTEKKRKALPVKGGRGPDGWAG
jgi:hypothetical protein